jgi:hypothetical protein
MMCPRGDTHLNRGASRQWLWSHLTSALAISCGRTVSLADGSHGSLTVDRLIYASSMLDSARRKTSVPALALPGLHGLLAPAKYFTYHR